VRRKPKPDAEVKARADSLAANGMPYQMAMAVAHGRMDLNEALERMARKDRVDALMERHSLSRALATQIALGHADLNLVLSRRRLDEHRRANRDRTVLVPGTETVLQLDDGRALKARIEAVEPYQVVVSSEGSAEPETLHKLKILYTYAPGDWKAVRKGIKSDKKSDRPPRSPAPRPQDRYTCSDKRLFSYLDQASDIQVNLLNGETLRGTLTWFGRYEFGLRLRTEADIVVFRHALREIGLVP
jgi:sRNA-binding regulator protein Hfq